MPEKIGLQAVFTQVAKFERDVDRYVASVAKASGKTLDASGGAVLAAPAMPNSSQTTAAIEEQVDTAQRLIEQIDEALQAQERSAQQRAAQLQQHAERIVAAYRAEVLAKENAANRIIAIDKAQIAAIERGIAARRREIEAENAAIVARERELRIQSQIAAARIQGNVQIRATDQAVEAGRRQLEQWVNTLDTVTPRIERLRETVERQLTTWQNQTRQLSIVNQRLAESRARYGENSIATQRLVAQQQRLTSSLNSTQRQLDRYNRELHEAAEAANRTGLAALNLRGNIVRLAAAFGLVLGVREVAQALRDFTVAGFEAVRDYQLLGFALQALVAREVRAEDATLSMAQSMTIAGERARNLLGWVDDLSLAAPFSRENIADTLRLTQAYGFTTEEAQRLTQAQLDLAAGAGFTDSQLQRVALALAQIRSRGKLAGEEIRQLTEAGVPALQILSEAFGITTSELIDMYEDGFVPAGDAIEALISQFESDFGGAAARAATETFQGLQRTLQNIIDIDLRIFWTDFFAAVQPLAEEFVETLKDPEFQRAIRTVGRDLGNFAGSAADSISAAREETSLWSRAWAAVTGELETTFETLRFLAETINLVETSAESALGALVPASLKESLREIWSETESAAAANTNYVDTLRDVRRNLEAQGQIIDREGLPALIRMTRAVVEHIAGEDELLDAVQDNIREQARLNFMLREGIRATSDYVDELDAFRNQIKGSTRDALDFAGAINGIIGAFGRAQSGLPGIGDSFLRDIIPDPATFGLIEGYIRDVDRLKERQVSAAQDIADAQAKAQQDIRETNLSAVQDIAEAWTDFNRDKAELDRRYTERVNDLTEDEREAHEDLASDIADIHEELADKLADITEDSVDARIELQEEIAESEEDLADRSADIAEKTAKKIENVTERFMDRQRDLSRQIEDILGDVPQSALDKYPDKPIERFLTVEGQKRLEELRRRLDDEREEYEGERADIEKEGQEELNDAREKHDEHVALLRKRFEEEEREREERARELRAEAQEEIADARDKHAKALAELQKRMVKEREEYDRRLVELRQQTQAEVALIERRQAEQLRAIQSRLREEKLEYERTQADIRREFEITEREYSNAIDKASGKTDEWIEGLRDLQTELFRTNWHMAHMVELTNALGQPTAIPLFLEDDYFKGRSPSPFEQNLQGMIDRLSVLESGWAIPLGAGGGRLAPASAPTYNATGGAVSINVSFGDVQVRNEADIDRIGASVGDAVISRLLSGQDQALRAGGYFPVSGR